MAEDSMKAWAEELVDLVTTNVHNRIRDYIEGIGPSTVRQHMAPSSVVHDEMGDFLKKRARPRRRPQKKRGAARPAKQVVKPKDELNQTAAKIIKYLGVGREKTAVELQSDLKLAGGTVRSILPKLVRQGYLQATDTKPMLYSNKQ